MRSTGTIVLVVVLLLVAFAGCSGVSTYNSMVTADESVEQALGNLQNRYQRRADLIPNLVSTVQGAADFEQETLTAVVEARDYAANVTLTADDLADEEKIRQFQAAQSSLNSSLGRLIAVAENYPQLRATEAFRDLQVQLEGTENRITVARDDYNEAVAGYNVLTRRFPSNIFAGLLGFERKVPFEAEAGAENAPTVDFGN